MMAFTITKLLFLACSIIVPLIAKAELKRPKVHTTPATAAVMDLTGDVPFSPENHIALAFSRLHYINTMEIEAGALAMRRGQSLELRKYGERLMRDFQIDDRALMAYAAKKNISMDRVRGTLTDLSMKSASMNQRLREASAEEFDRIFLKEMSRGHANTISELTGTIAQMPDRSARRFLSKMRPIIVQQERLGNILLEKNS